jgi:hypothetical protein
MRRIGLANVALTTVVVALAAGLLGGPDAAVVAGAVGVALAIYVAARPEGGGSTRPRLVLLAILDAAGLVVLNGVLVLLFAIGFCGGDGGEPSSEPGSERADYCDAFDDHQSLFLLTVFGAGAVTLVLGLIGARKDDGRRVLYAALAGICLTILIHLPEWTLPG